MTCHSSAAVVQRNGALILEQQHATWAVLVGLVAVLKLSQACSGVSSSGCLATHSPSTSCSKLRPWTCFAVVCGVAGNLLLVTKFLKRKLGCWDCNSLHALQLPAKPLTFVRAPRLYLSELSNTQSNRFSEVASSKLTQRACTSFCTFCGNCWGYIGMQLLHSANHVMI